MLISRLRDVRPYLYYVGYWSEENGTGQVEFEKGEAIAYRRGRSLRQKGPGAPNEGEVE